MWKPTIAFMCALIGAVPVAFSRDTAPYAIAYPILVGGVLCVAAAFLSKRRAVADKPHDPHIESFDANFDNFTSLQELAVVELTVRDTGKKQVSDAQLDLGFQFDIKRSPTEKFRLFRTAEGVQLIALDCDRFSAMLTAETLESFDRSFEKSLEATLLRFSGSSIPKEHLFAITNETAKDILKSDIRGNLATYLAKTNDHLFRRVISELRKISPKKESASLAKHGGRR